MKFLLLSLAFISAAALAAPEAKYVKLEKAKTLTVTSEKPADGVVTFTVDKNFHVQANPASKPNLIATTLTFTANPEFEIGAPIYPVGKPWRLPGSEEDVSTYDGKVEIRFPIKKLTARAGKATLEAKLRYQACDAKTCYFPMTIPVSIPLVVK